MKKTEAGTVITVKAENGREIPAAKDILSESLGHALIEHLSQAVFLKDANSAYVYCNRNFAEDLGINPEEIKGKTDYDFFSGHLARCYISIDRKVVETGEVHECEEKYIRHGREITVHTVKAPARGDGGKITGVLGIFWDITEKKKLEEEIRASKEELELKVRERASELIKTTEELRESEKKFKALFENIADIILIHDFEGRILEANTTAAEILGCGKEALKKQNIQDIEAPECAENFKERADRVKRTTSSVYQSAYLSSEGASIPVEVNSRVFEYAGNQCILAVCRNITERLASEEALLESAQKLMVSLDKSVEALASASEKRDPYTSGHQNRVYQLSIAIAKAMQLPDETLRSLELSAKIHDIGKLYVPAEILGKPRRLSASEFEIVRLHTPAGYDITKKIDFPQQVARSILQHHERLDGSGYPLHLKGNEISTPAKILAVADVVEAMTSHRPYRPAHQLSAALSEISENKNRLYDPEASEACIELFDSGKFKFEAIL